MCNLGTLNEAATRQVTLQADTTLLAPNNCQVLNNTVTVTADFEADLTNNSSEPIPITVRCPEVDDCPAPPPLAATQCTIIQSDARTMSITGPAGQIQGDVCIGPGGKLSMSGGNFITEDVRLAVGATCACCNKSGRVRGSVIRNVDLSTEIAACENAATSNTPVSLGGTGLDCTETIPSNGTECQFTFENMATVRVETDRIQRNNTCRESIKVNVRRKGKGSWFD